MKAEQEGSLSPEIECEDILNLRQWNGIRLVPSILSFEVGFAINEIANGTSNISLQNFTSILASSASFPNRQSNLSQFAECARARS